MAKTFNNLFLSLVCVLMLLRCGGAGESASESCALCGPMSDLSGSITGQFGTQAQMQGWVLVLIEKMTGVSRVAEVNTSGLFTFRNARTSSDQTIALLSPDYILQSVLSLPSKTPNTIHQFFKPQSPNLPRLIHSGPIVRMQDLTGIRVSRDLASDQNGDGIPDGSVSIGAVAALTSFPLQDNLAVPDLDLDGIPNDLDPDIDGDGVINILDPDDDGDAVYDVLDTDANGDFIDDTTQAVGNQYFPEGVEFISVQYELKPKADGSGNEQSLTFTTKVYNNVGPRAVQIRGAPYLLNDAVVQSVDEETGEATSATWDRRLLDDGLSNDSSKGDRIFAQKVTIAEGKQPPRPQEMVFFQLVFGDDDNPWALEFPYIFPPLKPGAITAKYEPNTRNVQLVGNPFGDQQNFVWSITLFDDTGLAMWNSQPILGTNRVFAIPDGIMVDGTAYQFSVVAQVLQKVPGYPSYSIHSPFYKAE